MAIVGVKKTYIENFVQRFHVIIITVLEFRADILDNNYTISRQTCWYIIDNKLFVMKRVDFIDKLNYPQEWVKGNQGSDLDWSQGNSKKQSHKIDSFGSGGEGYIFIIRMHRFLMCFMIFDVCDENMLQLGLVFSPAVIFIFRLFTTTCHIFMSRKYVTFQII